MKSVSFDCMYFSAWRRNSYIFLLFLTGHYIWIFLKIHTYHSLRMPCNLYNHVRNKEGHFTCSTKYFLCFILTYIACTFLKLNTYYSLRIPYQCFKFGCYRTITKGTQYCRLCSDRRWWWYLKSVSSYIPLPIQTSLS